MVLKDHVLVRVWISEESIWSCVRLLGRECAYISLGLGSNMTLQIHVTEELSILKNPLLLIPQACPTFGEAISLVRHGAPLSLA